MVHSWRHMTNGEHFSSSDLEMVAVVGSLCNSHSPLKSAETLSVARNIPDDGVSVLDKVLDARLSRVRSLSLL